MRDYDIRLHLKQSILQPYFEDGLSRVVEELTLPVARARIDIAVVNGHLHGFEIKSASDTLVRLPKQMEAYEKVFDYVSVITEPKYAEKVLAAVPTWVGIFICASLDGNTKIDEVRPPSFNENKHGFFVARLLRRDELLSVLDETGVPHKKRDRVWVLCESAATNIDVETLSLLVRHKLKQRHPWRDSL